MKHRALQKVWRDSKGNLVPDGHADACVLVAAADQPIPAKELARYPNAGEFFAGLEPAPEAPEAPVVLAPKVELEDDEDDVPSKPVKAGKKRK